jgi:hypothetical protein
MNKRLALCLFTALTAGQLYASQCATALLPVYQNGGAPYSCTENSGNLTVQFNNNVLPNYAGLSLLSLNNSAANPSSITVTPQNPGLSFTGTSFSESALVLSSQAELVQFQATANNGMDLTSTTFSLINPQTSAGGLGLGTGLAIGQELVCVGGSFTSLPAGLITTVANGVLGTGVYGCNGTTLVGTAAISSGPLSAITTATSLPSLIGLTNTAVIQLAPYNPTTIDVIKIQALLAVTGGSASTDGFGDTFAEATGTSATPEPSSGFLVLSGSALLAFFLARRNSISARKRHSRASVEC